MNKLLLNDQIKNQFQLTYHFLFKYLKMIVVSLDKYVKEPSVIKA